MPLEGAEPREVSGLTTSLILNYVEREGGREAVDSVLASAGLEGREDELCDESRWFADRRRVDLFVAAAEALDDPDVATHIGECALDFNIGLPLKVALRGLGSPRLIYGNIVRANAKFNTAHEMTMLDVSEGRATLRNVPREQTSYHPCDCQYNVGILSCVPLIFGLPAARVEHPVCIGRGAEECIFDVRWEEGRSPLRWTLAGLGLLAAAAIFAPAALPFAAVTAAILAIVAVRRAYGLRSGYTRGLEMRVSEQTEAAERMMGSLTELTSALDMDQVLARVSANAQAAVDGVEFALLTREGGRMRCDEHSRLPRAHRETIERWIESVELPEEGSLTIDDAAEEPLLAPLAAPPEPMGALCASPLRARGRNIGVLVAVSSGARGFLPRDVVQLESYAAQAAIALNNARLYRAQQELAIQDPLTGLYNHRHFHETLERELDRCRRCAHELGVVTLDLDSFKLVNDREGHAVGDEVLRSVGAAIEQSARRSDLAFRVGGDEFALILPMASKEDAAEVGRRAAEAVHAAEPRVEASWGAVSWPQSGPTKDALLTTADRAMYAMKLRGSAPQRSFSELPGPKPTTDSERKRERLACTSRISVRLAPLLDVEAIARMAVTELVDSFDFSSASVMRLDDQVLCCCALAGRHFDSRPEWDQWTQPRDAGISGRAASRNEPIVVADTVADPGYVGTGEEPDGRSELAAPIRVDGRLWGVLNLEHPEVAHFELEDVLFAETVAAACGAAIHRCELYGELESTFMRTLAVLGDALEAKDPYTAAHAREVAELAEEVGRRLGMEPEQVRNLSYGAVLHDIGKIGIRSEILLKPGRLTEAEYEEVKQHTILGARMLERIPFFAAVHPLVRSSHERWDGAGYPDGLAGEEIPLGARIIAACDAYHAMTSDRPYRVALSVAEARAELLEGSGSQFDPAVVEILVSLIDPEAGLAPIAEPAAPAIQLPSR